MDCLASAFQFISTRFTPNLVHAARCSCPTSAEQKVAEENHPLRIACLTLNSGPLISGGSVVKESSCQCRRHGFYPSVGKIPWRRKWQPTPVLLPEKPYGQRSLAGCSPRVCKESDTTERLNGRKCTISSVLFLVHFSGSIHSVVLLYDCSTFFLSPQTSSTFCPILSPSC